MPRRKTAEDRFWESVEPRNGCLEWARCLHPKGYAGGFSADGRQVKAHRWAYERWCGPIPDGLVIDHLCNNRACVYVGHLEPVTSAENTRRGVERRGHRCRRGHDLRDEEHVYYFEQEKKGVVYTGRQCLKCREITNARRGNRS